MFSQNCISSLEIILLSEEVTTLSESSSDESDMSFLLENDAPDIRKTCFSAKKLVHVISLASM